NAIRALRSRIVSDVAEIGGRLLKVKLIVGHGNWLPWLDREFGWTAQTAERFMRVHEFVEGLSNSTTVRNLVLTLPVSSVYLLAGRDRIKIGHARYPKARLRDLQGATADRLTLIRVIAGVGQPTERWLHKKFAHLRLSGEWFQFSPEMLDIVTPDEMPVPRSAKPTEHYRDVGEYIREAEQFGLLSDESRRWWGPLLRAIKCPHCGGAA